MVGPVTSMMRSRSRGARHRDKQHRAMTRALQPTAGLYPDLTHRAKVPGDDPARHARQGWLGHPADQLLSRRSIKTDMLKVNRCPGSGLSAGTGTGRVWSAGH